KHPTLERAIEVAGDHDVIEIDTDGPFVTRPLRIVGKSLTIRAAAQRRPVIKLHADGVKARKPLIQTSAPLVLEGLELWREDDRGFVDGATQYVIHADGPRSSVHAAN